MTLKRAVSGCESYGKDDMTRLHAVAYRALSALSVGSGWIGERLLDWAEWHRRRAGK